MKDHLTPKIRHNILATGRRLAGSNKPSQMIYAIGQVGDDVTRQCLLTAAAIDMEGKLAALFKYVEKFEAALAEVKISNEEVLAGLDSRVEIMVEDATENELEDRVKSLMEEYDGRLDQLENFVHAELPDITEVDVFKGKGDLKTMEFTKQQLEDIIKRMIANVSYNTAKRRKIA